MPGARSVGSAACLARVATLAASVSGLVRLVSGSYVGDMVSSLLSGGWGVPGGYIAEPFEFGLVGVGAGEVPGLVREVDAGAAVMLWGLDRDVVADPEDALGFLVRVDLDREGHRPGLAGFLDCRDDVVEAFGEFVVCPSLLGEEVRERLGVLICAHRMATFTRAEGRVIATMYTARRTSSSAHTPMRARVTPRASAVCINAVSFAAEMGEVAVARATPYGEFSVRRRQLSDFLGPRFLLIRPGRGAGSGRTVTAGAFNQNVLCALTEAGLITEAEANLYEVKVGLDEISTQRLLEELGRPGSTTATAPTHRRPPVLTKSTGTTRITPNCRTRTRMIWRAIRGKPILDMTKVHTSPKALALQMGVRVRTATTPHGWSGVCGHGRRLITVRPGLAPIQLDCTLMHELGHAHFGHTGVTGKQELLANSWAAHRLIGFESLLECAVLEQTKSAVAVTLGVLLSVLDVYLQTLTMTQLQELRSAAVRWAA